MRATLDRDIIVHLAFHGDTEIGSIPWRDKDKILNA